MGQYNIKLLPYLSNNNAKIIGFEKNLSKIFMADIPDIFLMFPTRNIIISVEDSKMDRGNTTK